MRGDPFRIFGNAAASDAPNQRLSSAAKRCQMRFKKVAVFHRTLPLAREANMPPKQRTAKKVNANLMHFKKAG